MKYAHKTNQDGETVIVDARGKPLSNGDADRPLLHVLPKLLVPEDAVSEDPWKSDDESWSTSNIWPENVSVQVTSSLPCDITPEGGIFVRQPYPNRRYFIGGSALIRNGWLVPLPLEVTEFDIIITWKIENAWLVFEQDDWEIKHHIHIKLHPGKGLTYSMDDACWPQDVVPRRGGPVTLLGIEERTELEGLRGRNVIRSELVFNEAEPNGDLNGYYLEENVDITGIQLDKAWSIDAFQDEQIHEVKQTAIFKQGNDSHRKNSQIEMPVELLVRAINLTAEVPFEEGSDFRKSIVGIPGGMERHPALTLLCEWWETIRPSGEPFKPGAAMPFVRVRDDDEYWCAYYETPNEKVEGFNPSGRNMARLGDFVLVLFYATQDVAKFSGRGMTIMLPSGESYSTIGIDEDDYLSCDIDEAWYCLRALEDFPIRFPAAWDFMNRTGSEYEKIRL